MTDDTTVSVTYAELAAARGVSVAAARRLTLRHRWPKAPGNDGLARVVVPVAFMEGEARAPGLDAASITAVAQATTDAVTVAMTDVVNVVADLRAQLDAANDRAARERARASALEAALAALRAKVVASRYARELVHGEVADLRAQVERLTAALARRRWWGWRP